MSHAGQYDTARPTAPAAPDGRPPAQTGWVGWVIFAAMMLVMVGLFHVIEEFVALFRDEVFLVGQKGLVVNVDYTAYGWTHIVVGLVAIGVGAGLFAGQMWARVVGVIVATLSAIANIAFMPAYPVWSAIMIAVDVLVIWALTVHGAEIKNRP